jgi:acyl transferase domain-containing protein/NAD(P)-dependent dehydrogenase (short-subunit alcohol dehydrogenase family)/acyl carrier protein
VTAIEIEAFLLQELAGLLGSAGRVLAEHERFVDCGLDSEGAVKLAARLSGFLRRPLPATLVWQYSTVRALAAHLGGARDAGASSRSLAAPRASRSSGSESSGYEVAVIGVGCRLPRADDAAAYWSLLARGVDTIGDAPADRWPVPAYYDADAAAPGKTVTRWGGFVDHALDFDAQAFGISPREAEHMDPQQRVALEVALRAFEDAGLSHAALRDARVGVFVGAMWTEYGFQLCPLLEQVTSHTVTGLDTSIISARISYTFGLAGPSLTVNTACSSSLVSLHLACQSLLLGESELALAGGVSLMLSPYSSVAMSKFGAMSPRARCRAFDAGADGYVRGEGCGFVVLKPLRSALQDGDPIRCVIRGSAINNDGYSNGLTAPNPRAQEAVIRAACVRAGVAPGSLHYVETHGPGTILGDPLEAGALGRTLGEGRPPERPLLIGSAKTNLGHLEAAAGIAGFLKLSLALQHREVPPNLHFDKPNPHIPFQELRLRVNTQHAAWPDHGVALAGVSAFGFGGTNCHVIAQEHARSALVCWPVAADSAPQLVERLRAVALAVGPSTDGATLEALCRGAAASAERGRFRKVLEASSLLSLHEGTHAVAPEPPQTRPQVVFVCPGQGGQWQGMCLSLIAEEPVFRAQIAACAEAITRHAGWSLWDQLFADTDSFALERADIVQPMVFSVQVALCALLRSWGVEPDLLIGHSMGEVAAAHLAGILSLDDAARVICVRSRLASGTAGEGGMAVVGLGGAAALAALEPYGGRLSVAAYNSHESTVVSGELDALQALIEALQQLDVYAAQVSVDFASHSAQMDPLRGPLMEALAPLRTHRARTRMISTVSTESLAGPECGPAYWADNLREPVRLMQVVDRCLEAAPTVFVELSPHPVLATALRKQVQRASNAGEVLATMRRDEPERTTVGAAVARLFELGVEVDWRRVAGPGRSLPASQLSAPPARLVSSAQPVLLTLSARTETALQRLAERYRDHLVDPSGPVGFVDDLAFTANTRRTRHRHRLAVLGTSADELARALTAHDVPAAATFQGQARPGMECDPVWLLPEPVLGSVLTLVREHGCSEPFQRAVDRCEVALSARIDWSVASALADDEAAWSKREDRLEIGWFVAQLALAEVWRAHGVRPRALTGRGTGELAAACLSGALTLDDAARVLVARAQLPRGLTGEPSQLEASALQLERMLVGLSPRKCELPFFSSVEGRALEGYELGARYWARHLRADARGFEGLWPALAKLGQSCFVELSPAPRLNAEVAGALAALELEQTPVLVPATGVTPGGVLRGVAALFCHGSKVDLTALHRAGGRVVELPGYQFDRQRFWPARAELAATLPAPPAPTVRSAPASCVLLGARVPSPLARAVYQTQLSLQTLPFMREHLVYDTAVVSGAQYLVGMLAAAARELPREHDIKLSALELTRSLPLSESDSVCLQTIVEDAPADTLRLSIASVETGAPASAAWRMHCSAQASAVLPGARALHDLTPARARCGAPLDRAGFYRQWQAAGYRLGSSFCAIESLARRDGEAVATMRAPSEGRAEGLTLACGLLDSLFQLIAMAGPGGAEAIAASQSVYAPVSVRELTIHRGTYEGLLGAHATTVTSSSEDRDVIEGDAVLTDASGQALATVSGLCLRRAPRPALLNEPTAPSVRGLRYHVDFVPSPATAGAARKGAWLVVAAPNADDIGAALLAQISATGARGELIAAATGEPTVHLTARLESALERLGVTLGDVVLLGHTLALPTAAVLLDDPVGAQQVTCGTLVTLGRLLTDPRRFAGKSPRLSVVTRAVQTTLGDSSRTTEPRALGTSCIDATLWGLCSVLAVEHPELATKRIDLEAGDRHASAASASSDVAALFNELLTSDREDQVVLRGAARLVPRLTPFGADAEDVTRSRDATGWQIEPDATQLVTGGLGGIGLQLAHWLVEQGARQLVLASRSQPSAQALEVCAALRKRGATVVCAQLDVSDAASVTELLSRIERDMPRLRGVFHAAGTLDDGTLQNLTWQQFERVLSPKLVGAVQLDRATAQLSLRHFVIFSSVASLLGLAGQANYAAANAFLDALAHDRRARGLPALSVNWGPWSDVGLAAAASARGARLAAHGLGSLGPAPSLEILGHALRSPHAQVVAMPFDADAWRAAHPQVRHWPLLELLGARAGAANAALPVAATSSGLRKKLESARTPKQRSALLLSFLREDAARVLRLPSNELQQDSPLVAQGMDSLMSQEFRNSLAAQLELKLPASLLWNFPTIRVLAEELGRRASEGTSGTPHATSHAASQNSAAEVRLKKGALAIAALDEAEVARLVNRSLNRNRTGV